SSSWSFSSASDLRAEVAVGPALIVSSSLWVAKHDQLVAVALQRDLSRNPLLSRLRLPLTRLQRAFDVDLAAFAQMLLGDEGEIVEDDDAVPLGLRTALAGAFIAPRFGGGDR